MNTFSPSIDERLQLRMMDDGVLFAAFLDIQDRKEIARLLRRAPSSSPQVTQAFHDIIGHDSQAASDALVFMIGRVHYAQDVDRDEYLREIVPARPLYLEPVEAEAGKARRLWLRRWRPEEGRVR